MAGVGGETESTRFVLFGHFYERSASAMAAKCVALGSRAMNFLQTSAASIRNVSGQLGP